MAGAFSTPGYRPDAEAYGLVVCLDAELLIPVTLTATILDNLRAAGALPPLVAVMASSIDAPTRRREGHCNPSFVEFLAQELLP